ARNLLATTAFSVNQIADITGVSVEKLQKLEDDEQPESEEEEETTVISEESRVAASIETPNESVVNHQKQITITSEQFNKALALTNTEMQNLDALIVGGEKEVASRSGEALELLKKLKMAVGLSPGGILCVFFWIDTLRQFRSDLLTTTFTDKEKQQLANEVQKATEEKEKETKFPCKYRVVIHPGAMAKEKVELTSNAVGKIHIGTCVTVEEIQGRRARISEPLVGCLSVHTDGEKSRIILQKEGTKSPEMEAALQAERGRQTKVLILKSITTLSDATVERLLEKSDWNLRNAIDAFYTAKYKTLEYVMKAQQQPQQQMGTTTETEKTNSSSTLSIPKENKPSTANPTGRRQSKLLFWKSWKKFTVVVVNKFLLVVHYSHNIVCQLCSLKKNKHDLASFNSKYLQAYSCFCVQQYDFFFNNPFAIITKNDYRKQKSNNLAAILMPLILEEKNQNSFILKIFDDKTREVERGVTFVRQKTKWVI
ncbi:hypothetical protein RFI_33757, partial [Reticulomyxa filosa]